MTFSKAKREFEIRYYLWATAEFEKEIDESFPNFHSFKAGAVWRLYQFMQQLNKSEQLILARSRLKLAHPEVVKALGENCSTEEESLRSKLDAFWRVWELYRFMQQLDENELLRVDYSLLKKYYADAAVTILGESWLDEKESLRSRLDAIFRLIPSSRETEILARKRAGEKIKFASKSKLRRSILTQFKEAFESECLELACVGLDPDLDFKMKCCGWILNTHFEFNGRDRQIHYWHDIMSPTTSGPHGGPAMMIGEFISFTAWLGITSQTQWEHLIDADIESACNAAINFCGRFIAVAPNC